MFYEEKLIDGIWHWRGHPEEEFKPMSITQLHSKIAQAESRAAKAAEGMRERAAKLCVDLFRSDDSPERRSAYAHASGAIRALPISGAGKE